MKKYRRSRIWEQWCGFMKPHFTALAFMNITFVRVALFERKTSLFFCRSVKVPVIPGNPGSRAPPLVATWKESVLCIARARTNACSLWYRPFQRGPLNRNSQPERRPILFPSSITGEPPRADTNRAKIKDAPANVASRLAALDFRVKKACIARARDSSMARSEFLQIVCNNEF